MENRQNQKKINTMKSRHVGLALIVFMLITGTFVNNAHAGFIRQTQPQFEEFSKKIHRHILQQVNGIFSSDSLAQAFINMKPGKKEKPVIFGSMGLSTEIEIGQKPNNGPLTQQSVPEPSIILLLGTGLLGLAGTIKRRKIKKF